MKRREKIAAQQRLMARSTPLQQYIASHSFGLVKTPAQADQVLWVIFGVMLLVLLWQLVPSQEELVFEPLTREEQAAQPQPVPPL